jgi:hypothetical protein
MPKEKSKFQRIAFVASEVPEAIEARDVADLAPFYQ